MELRSIVKIQKRIQEVLVYTLNATLVCIDILSIYIQNIYLVYSFTKAYTLRWSEHIIYNYVLVGINET